MTSKLPPPVPLPKQQVAAAPVKPESEFAVVREDL